MRSLLLLLALASSVQAQSPATAMRDQGLRELRAFDLLRDLTRLGHRLSGSAGAERAVEWGAQTMRELGFENVRLQPCRVPHWVRGEVATLTLGDDPLSICALGGSIGTPPEGLEAEVVEVKSVDEAAKLGSKAKGKIVFFNGPMDPTLTNTFAAYGGAVGQRVNGAATAAKLGAVGVLVRSMTLRADDVPHTGTMRYEEGGRKIPAAALSLNAADKLSATLRRGPARVRLTLDCENLPPVPSSNVIGEITGSDLPDEIVLMGGHLDSWDLGVGAHDDGAGCVQSIEALRLIRSVIGRPKRTVRVVLFMDEEQTGAGADAYAFYAKISPEKHVAAIESDAGGFTPRAFGTSETVERARRYEAWLPDLRPLGITEINGGGGGGADVAPLGPLGAVLFGLRPDSQRYFDVHHSRNDTLDWVNARELEMGAIGMAILAWRLAGE
ncbi:MAG: M20/M25/M40 family metallo-hydrolase [Fimbriimonadaceae bacterium]|nr:M20/M25/M40 family metallo-hydrolase [Fimbriimonadaceae bacterium]